MLRVGYSFKCSVFNEPYVMWPFSFTHISEKIANLSFNSRREFGAGADLDGAKSCDVNVLSV